MRAPLTAVTLCLLAACSPNSAGRGPTEPLTALPRELTSDEKQVSLAANSFAFDLFRRLNTAEPGRNLFISPLSISFSLGMAMNGADGETLAQMRSTLGFGQAELAAINDGFRGLMALEQGLDPATILDIANSVWYRDSYPFRQSYIDGVRQAFSAEVVGSPFDAATVGRVNNWVSEQTNGRIKEIVKAIRDEDVMFLINAVYFKGTWRSQFDPRQTRPGEFRGAAGTQSVQMMNHAAGAAKIRYAYRNDAIVGELPYGNGAFVMTIVMPSQDGNIDALVATLDTARWNALLAPLQEATFQVMLPKFTFEYERELKDDLRALGMVDAFAPNRANLSRMSDRNDLYLSFVKHKSFVEVNEEGTEAAAVTNTGVGVTSLPPCLCVDRPFIFAIRERFSGTVLFLGKVLRIPG